MHISEKVNIREQQLRRPFLLALFMGAIHISVDHYFPISSILFVNLGYLIEMDVALASVLITIYFVINGINTRGMEALRVSGRIPGLVRMLKFALISSLAFVLLSFLFNYIEPNYTVEKESLLQAEYSILKIPIVLSMWLTVIPSYRVMRLLIKATFVV